MEASTDCHASCLVCDDYLIVEVISLEAVHMEARPADQG